MQIYLWMCILAERCIIMVLCMASPQLGSSIKRISPSGIPRTLWISQSWFNNPIWHQISYLYGDIAASGPDFNLTWKADMVCIGALILCEQNQKHLSYNGFKNNLFKSCPYLKYQNSEIYCSAIFDHMICLMLTNSNQ